MIIEGSKVVAYMYDTEHEQFVGNNWDKAADKFAKWIKKNTPYKGICGYRENSDVHSFYVTKNGNKYEYNGGILYKSDEHYNMCVVDENRIKGE